VPAHVFFEQVAAQQRHDQMESVMFHVSSLDASSFSQIWKSTAPRETPGAGGWRRARRSHCEFHR
jgi:hypothetical protein